jgi:hypothetical protein
MFFERMSSEQMSLVGKSFWMSDEQDARRTNVIGTNVLSSKVILDAL